MRRWTVGLCMAMALAACSQENALEGRGFAEAEMRVAAPMITAAGGEAAAEAADQPTPEAAGFFLAYRYSLGLEAPGAALAGLMDAHAATCQSAGPAVCQLIAAQRSGDPDSFMSGSVELRAQPAWLTTFMAQVESSTGDAGGMVRERGTQAEDLTRQIVDTDARVNALRTLRDRLLAILATRPGRLADLLEVERELARVQGELDATASTLAVLRQRVDMSELTVTYTMQDRALTPRTFEPIGEAISDFLGTASFGVAMIIRLFATLLPWAALAALVWFVLRRLRWHPRLPAWGRRDSPPAPPPSED